MEYILSIHGDFLEKNAAIFVNTHLNNYEKIWKVYIGNRGDQTKATILNYPYESKRQEFWEFCYTVLESSFLSYNIVNSGVFLNPIIEFSDYEEFNKNLIAFFAHIGRINDNIRKAGEKLGININDSRLNKFYSARNIVIHGKVIPFSLDDIGLIKFPIFSTSPSASYGWPADSKTWVEGHEIQQDYVSESLNVTILEYLQIINDIFGKFLTIIYSELKSLSTKIYFEYRDTKPQYGFSGSGGFVDDNFCIIQFPVSQSKF